MIKKYNNINFITGEKIELITELILGIPDTINQNSNIRIEHQNVQDINSINSNFDNPKYIYLYPDCYSIFKEKIHYFNNPFVLVSNNSDYPVIIMKYVLLLLIILNLLDGLHKI
jgi:hypothetical protein